MPKRTEYAQGTPNWVDLQTTDQSAAKNFYGSLFGWSFDDQPSRSWRTRCSNTSSHITPIVDHTGASGA